MSVPIVLASGSAIRRDLLKNAGLTFEQIIPRIDEQSLKEAMQSEAAPARDIADALAEMKARKVADKQPDAMVIGCDQVLSFDGKILSKPVDPDDARAQLRAMRNNRHSLLSAAVIYHEGQPVWRHIGHVRLRMRDMSDGFIGGYVERNWDQIRHTVGAYQLESEGVRLFHSIEGDYFHVLGMPLLEILAFLTLRGVIEG